MRKRKWKKETDTSHTYLREIRLNTALFNKEVDKLACGKN